MKHGKTSIYIFVVQGSTDFDLEPLDPLIQQNLTFSYNSRIMGGQVNIPYCEVIGLTDGLKVISIR